jgi:hypothetical protein
MKRQSFLAGARRISAIQKPEVGRPDPVHQPPVMTDA